MKEKEKSKQNNIDAGIDRKLYEEVEDATFFQFKTVGDMLAGQLTDKGKSDRYGFGLYDLKDKEGDYKRFHGTKQLDDLLKNIPVFTDIIITYIDVANMPQGEMKLFSVLKKKDVDDSGEKKK